MGSESRLFMLAAMFLWVVLEAINATLHGYAALQIVWTRYGTHLLLMVMAFGPRHGFDLVKTGRRPLQIVRGLLMLAMPSSYVLAARTMHGSDLLSIFWLAPLITLALGHTLLGERAPWRWWLTTLLAYLGTLPIFSPGSGVLAPGSLFAIGMAASMSLYLVLTRSLSRTEALLTNLFYTAAAVFCPLSVALPAFWRPPTLGDGTKMIVIGLLGFAALWLLEKALGKSPASELAPIIYTQPLWTLAARSLGLGRWPSVSAITGGIVLCGCLLDFFLQSKPWRRGPAASRPG